MNLTTRDRDAAAAALVANGLTPAEAGVLLDATDRDYRTHGSNAAMVAYDLESGTYTVAAMDPMDRYFARQEGLDRSRLHRCPFCGALRGMPCTDRWGLPTSAVHPDRAAAGGYVGDPYPLDDGPGIPCWHGATTGTCQHDTHNGERTRA